MLERELASVALLGATHDAMPRYPMPSASLQATLGVRLTRHLADGAFKSVFEGRLLACGTPIACSVEAVTADAEREVAVAERLSTCGGASHPNIIRSHARTVASARRYTILELAPNGELFDVLADSGVVPEDQARSHFSQMVSAVRFMHMLGVTHSDIKLENCVFTSSGKLKLIDFGLAHIATIGARPCTEFDFLRNDAAGTRSYMAPEIVANKMPYDPRAADVWALAATLFALATGFFAFKIAGAGDTRFRLMREAQQRGQSSVRALFGMYDRPVKLSEQLVTLLDGMLRIDPAQWLSLEEVVASDWLAKDLVAIKAHDHLAAARLACLIRWARLRRGVRSAGRFVRALREMYDEITLRPGNRTAAELVEALYENAQVNDELGNFMYRSVSGTSDSTEVTDEQGANCEEEAEKEAPLPPPLHEGPVVIYDSGVHENVLASELVDRSVAEALEALVARYRPKRTGSVMEPPPPKRQRAAHWLWDHALA